MQRIKSMLKNDKWILLLDILAVNLAYFLALSIRVSISDIGGIFKSAADVPAYFSAFYRFAPIYTILCIVVFLVFKLYGGVWRYAGANDMLRILEASVVTCALQVVGTILITRRMPLTYYILGAVLQLIFVTVIRFARKIVAAERKKRSKKSGKALVVGAGELGQQTIQSIQSGDEFKVDCIVDTENEAVGRMLDGLPVYSLDQLQYTLEHDHIACVFLAEPNLKEADRKTIQKTCSERKIEMRESRMKTVMPSETRATTLQFVPIAYDEEYSMSQEEAWLQSIVNNK